MATIICPSCGKELGDDVSFCPKCGAPIKADSLEKVTNLSQEKNTETEDVTKLNNNDEQNSTIQKKKPTKKTIIIVAIIVIIAIIASIFGIKSQMDKKARQEYIESYNTYVDDINDLKDLMLKGAAKSESLCNLTSKVWYNSIWKKADDETDKFTQTNGSFVSDFNDALFNLNMDSDTIIKIKEINTNVDDVKAKFKKMKNYPEELKHEYETLQKMYDSYISFTDLAIEPTGSYKTYNDKFVETDSEFMDLYKKVSDFDIPHLTE